MNSKSIFLILCGGQGQRLWPITAGQPKQFFALKSGKTLLELTLQRMLPLVGKFGLVLNLSQIETAQALLKNDVDIWIAEPFTKNTAPAIAFSVLKLLQNNAEETVVVFAPCDQMILQPDLLLLAINQAVEMAQLNDKIVLLGFESDKLDASLGYFLPDKNNCIKKFVEKPDFLVVSKLIEQGALANAGIFVGKLVVFYNVLLVTCPDLIAQLQNYQNTDSERALIKSISFDHAVLQKTVDLMFVNAGCQIIDVGKIETFTKFEEVL